MIHSDKESTTKAVFLFLCGSIDINSLTLSKRVDIQFEDISDRVRIVFLHTSQSGFQTNTLFIYCHIARNCAFTWSKCKYSWVFNTFSFFVEHDLLPTSHVICKTHPFKPYAQCIIWRMPSMLHDMNASNLWVGTLISF